MRYTIIIIIVSMAICSFVDVDKGMVADRVNYRYITDTIPDTKTEGLFYIISLPDGLFDVISIKNYNKEFPLCLFITERNDSSFLQNQFVPDNTRFNIEIYKHWPPNSDFIFNNIHTIETPEFCIHTGETKNYNNVATKVIACVYLKQNRMVAVARYNNPQDSVMLINVVKSLQVYVDPDFTNCKDRKVATIIENSD